MSVSDHPPPAVANQSIPVLQAAGELFQFSIMDALLEGLYEGEMTFARLAAHGDFGIGTFNDLDGEMIALDGRFYQLRSDGSATLVSPEQKTPFASVVRFLPQVELRVSAPTSQTGLEQQIQKASSANLFTAIKVQGTFALVQTRTVGRQVRPFPPLTEAAAHERIHESCSVRGTLVGFYTPAFAQGIGVSGFHVHFISSAGDTGGHVLSYELEEGMVQLMQLCKLRLELPRNEAFLNASLDIASATEMIQAAEGTQHS